MSNAPRNRGNPMAAGQVGNTGGGRASIDTRRARGTARGGPGGDTTSKPSFDATPYPGGFSFTKASKGQCEEGLRYALREGSDEVAHFKPLAIKAVKAAAALPTACTPPLVASIAASNESLSIHSFQYGQLKKEHKPPISERDPPKNDPDWVPTDGKFDIYTATVNRYVSGTYKPVEVTFVQSPVEGEHYEQLSDKASAFCAKMLLTPDGQLKEAGAQTAFCLDKDGDVVDVADGLPEYAVQLHLALRPADCLYSPADKAREVCVAVSFGEIRSGDFMAWVRRRPSTAQRHPSPS
jgi:hypothetical protein